MSSLCLRAITGWVVVAVFGVMGVLAAEDVAKEKNPPAPPLSKGGQRDAPPAFSAEQLDFFEKSVRPLLADNCFECHSARKQESKLRLDSREAVLAGGENGPAVVPGAPEQSLLISAVHYADDHRQMPPKGKLDAEKIEALTKWVKIGAPWPPGNGTAPLPDAGSSTAFQIRPEDRQFWSFVPVAAPPLPVVGDTKWPKCGVDAFILAKLENSGLAPAPAADKRTLIRRATFDLTGLSPTPEEVRVFLADPSSDAFAKVVDRLLDSPHYGERQARWWLDVARYGEDQAHTFEARKYPNGFRYRDWLIGAFNQDLPYDEFIQQQIAADLLEGENQRERLPALGYFACGPVYYGDKNQMDQIADRIDTLTRGFLGLTVACARCHDHKYDPISTVDYYALAGIFASTEYVEVPLISPVEVEAANKSLTEQEKKQKNPPKKYPFIHALKDKPTPQNLRVHLRGNAETLGSEAPRRFVEILCGDTVASAAATKETERGDTGTSDTSPGSQSAQPFSQGSGRLELAAAIASPDNPLTARVLVNRLWQQHFGKGLVRTPGNFGRLGERPTHPELLDYLAAKFVASGWSIKAMHREIVLSATYQQSAAADEAAHQADPENKLWGRVHPRRLEVESWRDAMLTASGQLDRAIGGPSLDLALAENRRRTLYGQISRHELDPLLRLFDFPDPNITSDQRAVTTVPLQQLFVLNSEFMVANAKALAARLQKSDSPDDTVADDAARIGRAFELLYARPATAEEVRLGVTYLSAADGDENGNSESKLTRWERYAQALLAANEFLYVD